MRSLLHFSAARGASSSRLRNGGRLRLRPCRNHNLAVTLAVLMLAVLAEPAAAQLAGSDDSGLGEIVVTAQKRAENLQRVPIAITVVTADQLDRQPTVNSAELAHHVPGLLI